MHRINRVFLGWIVSCTLLSARCVAQTTAIPYVVLSDRLVMVSIDCTSGCPTAELTNIRAATTSTAATITPVISHTNANHTAPNPGWALVAFSGPTFQSGGMYSLTVTHPGGSTSQDTFQIDTAPTVTIAQGAGRNSVDLRSSVAMTLPGKKNPLANIDLGDPIPPACVQGTTRQVVLAIQLVGLKVDFGSTGLCEIDPTTLQNVPLDAPGAVSVIQGTVTSRHSVKDSTSPKPKPIEIPGLSNVLGATLQLEAQSPLTQPKPPANESAAWLWVDGTITAGTGAAPAWVVEEKFAPLTAQLNGGNVVTWLAVTANIGNNKIGGVGAKDVIDFIGPSLTNYHDWKKVGTESSIAPTYETNRAFSHRNLLAVGDIIWDLGILNRSQFVRTARTQSPAKMPKTGDYKGGYNPLGWNLHVHTGIETGNALASVVVTNSITKAVVGTIPTYGIFRLVPQVDGIFQYKWLQLEDLFTGRYLFLSETTAVDDKRGNPYLETLSGAKAINALTFSVTPTAQHFALTIAYTNGFAAPTYQRANGVKIGVDIKY